MSVYPNKSGVVRALAAIFPFLALSACLENAGIASKAGTTLAKSQSNCLAPDSAAVKNIALRLAASSVEVASDFCTKADGYECYLRRFSPTLANGQTTTEETSRFVEFGGTTAFKLRTQTYNTREASRAPGVSAVATQSGGDYNRSEYVCHQLALKDGTTFLAVGDGDTLDEALAAAYAKCSGVAPRLATGK